MTDQLTDQPTDAEVEAAKARLQPVIDAAIRQALEHQCLALAIENARLRRQVTDGGAAQPSQ